MGCFDTNSASQLGHQTKDPIANLEKEENQKKKLSAATERFNQLVELSQRDYADDYDNNATLRRSYRGARAKRDRSSRAGKVRSEEHLFIVVFGCGAVNELAISQMRTIMQ